MSDEDKVFYEVLNAQSNYIFDRAKSIETKAISISVFIGVILGVEYSFIYNFSSSIPADSKIFFVYLVTINTAFLVSSSILSFVTFFERDNLYVSDVLCPNECKKKVPAFFEKECIIRFLELSEKECADKVFTSSDKDCTKRVLALSEKIEKSLQKREQVLKSKERFIAASIAFFTLGIAIITYVFYCVMRYKFQS